MKEGEKAMLWCPITQKDCKQECAWFAEGECAFIRLHEVANKMNEVVDALESLEDTIKNKTFE